MRFWDWLGGVITASRAHFSSTLVGGALATVAFCSGFISYTHISALTLTEGQSWKTAHLYPLVADGQIVIGSVYFMEHPGEKRRWWGLIGIVPGVLESLYANWQSGWANHDLGAAMWATIPAQAFACSAFLFELWLRSRRERRLAAGELATATEAALGEALRTVEGLQGELATVRAWRDEQQLVIERLQAARASRRRATAPPPPAEGEGAPGAVNPAPAPELPPLPQGEALRLLLATLSGNEIARRYDVTRWTAQKMVNDFKAGTLVIEDGEDEGTGEVSEDGEGAGRAA